jgi:hypothetical protein
MSEIRVDTISEKTSASGVTIDGLTIKDGNIIGDVALAGTTPTFTIGDAGAEDASLIFDGNAQDFYIALDDSADDLVIGTGSTVGSNVKMVIENGGNVGIGTASPNSSWSGANNLVVSDTSSDGGITIISGTSGNGNIMFADAQAGAFSDARGLITYLHNGDSMRFITANAEAMRIDSSGQVGIGTSSPNQLLTVVKAQNADTAIRIANGTGGTAARASIFLDVDSGGAQLMAIDDGFSTSGAYIADNVTFVSDTSMANGMTIGTRANDNNAHLRFYTKDAERMRISGAGNVGIGETTPLGKFHVSSADSGASVDSNADELVVEGSGSSGISILSGTGNEGAIKWGDSGDNNIGFISYDHAGNDMYIGVNAATRVKVHDNGVAAFNNGIALGVGTANTASNVLDDYEEGTWTIILEDHSDNAFTLNSSQTTGTYIKIGGQVTITGYFIATAINSASGSSRISGLPFNILGNDRNYAAMTIGFAAGLNITAGTSVAGVGIINSANVNLTNFDVAAGSTNLTCAKISGDGQMVFTMTYTTV